MQGFYSPLKLYSFLYKYKKRDLIQDSSGLSSHVMVHIMANEDKYMCELTTFQRNFQQINHLQFYPCPLGRLMGPWCSIRRVMRAPSVSALYELCMLLQTRENKWASEAISLEARHFLEMVWRPDLQDHPSTSLSAHQDFIKWWAGHPNPTPPLLLHSIITPPAPLLLSAAPLCSQTKWGNSSSGRWQTPGWAVKINDPKY